ncbi:ribonuclease III [bacterium]|nr:ribonuclease III [bacterium]
MIASSGRFHPAVPDLRLFVLDRIAGWTVLLEQSQTLLKYRFLKVEFVREALTHSSFSNEDRKLNPSLAPMRDNERLEFLGDAVIGLVVAQLLMERYPDASEGKLSRWRSYLVSRRHLAELAWELGIGDLILLGQGEKRSGGAEKRSILAAALEALVGAVYLDGGLLEASALLSRVFELSIRQLALGDGGSLPSLDNKTYLQEVTQSLYKSTPVYRMVDSWGPEHDKTFRVEIHVDGRFFGTGDGRSKKDAEQKAASLALESIERERQVPPVVEGEA